MCRRAPSVGGESEAARSFMEPQHHAASELQSVRATERQSYRATERQSCRATEMQSFRASDLQSYRASDLQSCRATELQSYRAAELQSYRAAELQSCRATELQRYRAPVPPRSRFLGTPDGAASPLPLPSACLRLSAVGRSPSCPPRVDSTGIAISICHMKGEEASVPIKTVFKKADEK
ncbi:hypothetical protein EYF80_055361 [Liparis tanakae]|uniref:Uncharacterized protein n=1 Tax=Liparis tanakae TaxID=230148 RepID=A0A4Z2F025_9TELE|nr:hypothetical protein EYF80_055361 [Liparis tanakae]